MDIFKEGEDGEWQDLGHTEGGVNFTPEPPLIPTSWEESHLRNLDLSGFNLYGLEPDLRGSAGPYDAYDPRDAKDPRADESHKAPRVVRGSFPAVDISGNLLNGVCLFKESDDEYPHKCMHCGEIIEECGYNNCTFDHYVHMTGERVGSHLCGKIEGQIVDHAAQP